MCKASFHQLRRYGKAKTGTITKAVTVSLPLCCARNGSSNVVGVVFVLVLAVVVIVVDFAPNWTQRY